MKTQLIHHRGNLFTHVMDSHTPGMIIHCCNNIGKWGKGFVLALSSFDLRPEKAFIEAYRKGINSTLGDVQFVPLDNGLVVANIIGQHQIWTSYGVPPFRLDAFRAGCEKTAQYCLQNGISQVHAPLVGAGLAGGSWGEIEPMLETVFCESGIQVNIYTL